MDYQRISSWKRLQWDPTSHGEAFAHLYATALTGDMVDVDVSDTRLSPSQKGRADDKT